MSDSFDPYHKWLGISPKDQPPNHYRLLAIERFESDPDVIEGAADQRMAHVRTFQAGQNSALSQRILNELSAAKLCLLNSQKKADYDRELKAGLESPETPSAPVAVATPQFATAPTAAATPLPIEQPPPLVMPLASAPSALVRRSASARPAWRQPAILGGTGAAAVLLVAVAYFALSGGASSSARNDIAQDVPLSPAASAATPAPKPSASIASTPPSTSPDTRQVKIPSVAVSPVVKPTVASSDPDFEILEATWGAEDKRVDVTAAVREQVKNNRLVTMAWQNLVGSPEDPAKGANKTLRLRYRARARTYDFEYPHFFFIYLDGNPLAPPTDASDGLELLEARYGAGTTYLDVLPEAQARVRNGRFDVAADDFYQQDLVPEGWDAGKWANIYRVLWIRYRSATGEHFAYAWTDQRLTIDCRPLETAGPAIDLLKQIDVKQDAVKGDWTLDGKGLVAPGGMYDRLQFPADAPDEYALTVVVEADDELRDVAAGLVVSGRQVICCLDGGKGLSSGMNLIGGAWFHNQNRNPTYSWRMSRLLEQGRPNTLTCLVRKTGVRLLRDGAELVRWSGDPQTLSLPGGCSVPNPRRPYIQSYDRPFRVIKAQLSPLAPAKTEVLTHLESERPVNALQILDLERDQVHGAWQFDGRALVSPADQRGMLQIPAVLPEEYQLEVVAARVSNSEHFSITLPIGSAQTSVILDAYGGKVSGLESVDGKNFKVAGQNETRYEGELFADGKPKTIVIVVRKNQVRVACEGQTIIDWTGDVSRLAPKFKLPYKDRAYLGSWFSSYRIKTIKLTPISSPASSSTLGPADDASR